MVELSSREGLAVRIGELARAAGATPRSLRLYERVGLITAERSANGYRQYGSSAITRVRNIRSLLSAGLTLDDIRAFEPCLDGDVTTAPPSVEGVRIARQRLRTIDARLAAQSEVRDRLATHLAEIDGRRRRVG